MPDILTTPEELDQLHFLHGQDDDNDDTEIQKIKPVVTIPDSGKEIYKATLVSLLNKDPKLSSDRYLIVLFVGKFFLSTVSSPKFISSKIFDADILQEWKHFLAEFLELYGFDIVYE